MEEDRSNDESSAEKGRRRGSSAEVSAASRSLFFAAWGVFLMFIALNPLGLFMMLYVLAVPAWAMGCAGFLYGIRSLAKRQGARPAAIVGVVLNSLILLLPLYPFVAG